jgi:hypothetical protein
VLAAAGSMVGVAVLAAQALSARASTMLIEIIFQVFFIFLLFFILNLIDILFMLPDLMIILFFYV